jgi:hypothetical protein
MSATPLASRGWTLPTQPTIEDPFQQGASHLLARFDHLLFQVLELPLD